ncbi:hypothetical protein [Peptoniphilus raoultii]|uniref:hypothetical protein n=1 Tax=Peptoniphilus raoultii TaxID=1776387 RepID=UPI0008DAE6A3|nr:hypothetical protein [Peptoniphilus raoultii]
MKNFNKIYIIFTKVLRTILIILFVFLLAFTIKWKIDEIYINAKVAEKIYFSPFDEIKKSSMEFQNLIGKNNEEYEIPVVVDEKKDENFISIVLPEECDIDTLGKILLENKLIADIPTYKNLAERMGIESSIVAGSYDIKKDMKVKEILALISGKALKTYQFTIGQGANADDLSNLLKNIGLIESVPAFKNALNAAGVNSFKTGDYEIEMPLKVKYIIDQIKAEPVQEQNQN